MEGSTPNDPAIHNKAESATLARIQEIRDKNWVAEMVLRRGDFRDTSPLLPGQATKISNLIEETVAMQGYCFSNAQDVALRFDKAVYVEGFVYFINEDSIYDHAWVEIDGRVAELTWEERPQTPENAVYIGIGYEDDTLMSALDERFYDCTISHWIIRRAHEESDGPELDIDRALRSLTASKFED